MSQNKQDKIDILTLALALISWSMVLTFRYHSNWGLGWFAIVQPVFGLAMVGILRYLVLRCQSQSQITRSFGAWWIVSSAGMLGLGVLGRRHGFGDSWEMLTLLLLGNLCLGMAMLAQFPRWRNGSVLFSAICCFVVLPISTTWITSFLAVVFGCGLLIWLITEYWRKVDQKLASDQTRRPWSPKAIAVIAAFCMIGLIGSVAIFLAPQQQLDLPGLSWFAGGKRWSDEFANEGSGDGNKVRAATDRANSLGPVDSDIFMESKRESLFDVASEAYGEPRKANKNRAIALESEVMQHNHSRVARSQKASAEFSTKRKTDPSDSSTNPKDQIVDALFFLKGRIPLRLAMETYNTFDDGVWKQIDPPPRPPKRAAIEKNQAKKKANAGRPRGNRKRTAKASFEPVHKLTQNGYPWMSMRRHPDTLYAGHEYTTLKITNLKSLRIPSPPCMEQFYIDQVDRENFFGVGTDEIAQLTNGSTSIPDMTVLHILSSGINLYDAQITPEKIKKQQLTRVNKNQKYLSVEAASSSIVETAQQWTAGLNHDWDKISTILQRLRTDFTHDRKAVLPENESDVASYLLQEKVGSDYMFATAAALMFRSLGIPSRVVTGFMANEQGYDRGSGHTAVTASDIHVWTEVSLDGVFWIPVEPTPGYSQPRYQLTWLQRCTLAILGAYHWVLSHPLMTACMLLVSFLIIWNFRWIVNALVTARWLVISRLLPNRLVLETARLIDKRAALAGVPRPANRSAANFSQWLAQRLDIPETDTAALKRFTRKLDRLLYHPKSAAQAKENRSYQIVADCQRVIQNLQFHRIRQTQKSSAKRGGSKSPC